MDSSLPLEMLCNATFFTTNHTYHDECCSQLIILNGSGRITRESAHTLTRRQWIKEDGSHCSNVEHCFPFSFYFHRPKDRLRWFLIERIMYALLYRAIEAERVWIQSENVDRCRRYFQIPSYNKVRNTKNIQRLAIHERVSKHHSWEIIIVSGRDGIFGTWGVA